MKVIIATVTYGDRWKFLSQMLNAVMGDKYLHKLILIDNASQNALEIDEFALKNSHTVELIREENNTGSAAGFAKGIARAAAIGCDFVLLLDDDNVPETDFIQKYIINLNSLPNKKAVILGNRNSFQDHLDAFNKEGPIDNKMPNTSFENISFKKLKNYICHYILPPKNNFNKKCNPSMVEVKAFAYGGSFIPIQAIREAPLPDIRLFSYGDDVQYSWGMRRLGYKIYACASPIIKDIDLTFQNSHILDMFSKDTPDFKIFFLLRNRAAISKASATQSNTSLWLNMIVWYVGLCTYSFLRKGINKFIIRRAYFIWKSLYKGMTLDFRIPKNIAIPGNIKIEG